MSLQIEPQKYRTYKTTETHSLNADGFINYFLEGKTLKLFNLELKIWEQPNACNTKYIL